MSTELLAVEDSNKHIIEEIVRQVGHLPEFSETICVVMVVVDFWRPCLWLRCLLVANTTQARTNME